MFANHPITRLDLQPRRKFRSLLQRIISEFPAICKKKLETIKLYIISPWELRISYKKFTPDGDANAAEAFFKEDRLLVIIVAAANKHKIAYGIAQASRYASVVTGMRLNS